MDFPIENKYKAYQVTIPSFFIGEFMTELYVNTISSRKSSLYGDLDLFSDLDYCLEVHNIEGFESIGGYPKILIGGHRGCGKSVELYKYHLSLRENKKLYSIYIEYENYHRTEYQIEDVILIFLLGLSEEAILNRFDINEKIISELIADLSNVKESMSEVSQSSVVDLGFSTEVEGGIPLFLKLKAILESHLKSESKRTVMVRERVKNKQEFYIRSLNEILSEFRKNIKKEGLGRDFVFIVDGSEKASYQSYEELFIYKETSLKQIQTKLIFSIPIQSYYVINNSAVQANYTAFELPMISLDEHGKDTLERIIRSRIKVENFFSVEVLKKIVILSGGSPRQLLMIVSKCLLKTKGEEVTKKDVEEIGLELGKKDRKSVV